jgi:hypothetical protein
MGGLGNQLFQYAYARMLKKLGYSVELDIQTFYQEDNYNPETTFRSYLLDKFQTTIPSVNIYKSKFGFMMHGFRNKNIFLRKTFKLLFYFWYKKHVLNCDELKIFDPNLLKLSKDCYISGYFQSIRYFSDIDDILRNELKLKNEPAGNFYYNLIRSKSRENTIAIHIRRGDYCGSGNELPFAYYQNAIDYMISRIKGALLLFIFSDDLEYVKENFSFPYQTFYINEDHSLEDFEELIIMTECRHFIIANSSFSWWAAWLSGNPDKIICVPSQWTADSGDQRDIIPDYFIKIPYLNNPIKAPGD